MTASLMGESVHLKVTYSTLTQEVVFINEVLIDRTFDVTNVAEIAQAISYTFKSGGFDQTLSGTLGADIAGDTATFSFAGTAQPGSLVFELTSIADQSVQSISGFSIASTSGFEEGVHYVIEPTLANNNLTASLGLLGFQPGTNLRETIKLNLVERVSETDTTPPDTQIVQAPAPLSNSPTATFVFASTETGGKFQSSTDGIHYQDSPSSKTLSGLADGEHTLFVRAVDAAGNIDPTPVTYTWTVDTVAPEVGIVASPVAQSNQTSATFQFSASEPGSSFEVSLDQAGFSAASKDWSFSGLADGAHTLAVRAIDAAGNVGKSVSYDWTVDTTAPVATISDHPATLTNTDKASFTFATKETNPAGVSYEIMLDGGKLPDNSASLLVSDLDDGMHTLEVTARDAAGNIQTSPTRFTWEVDTVAPTAQIVSNPQSLTNKTTADFAFETQELDARGVTYTLTLDGKNLDEHTARLSLVDVQDGDHRLLVTATDAAGNVQATATSFDWTVDTKAPETSILTSPILTTFNGAAVFEFGSSEGTGLFQVSLDGKDYVDAASTFATSVSVGKHTIFVRAVDDAGNVDATPAAFTWSVVPFPSDPNGGEDNSPTPPTGGQGPGATDATDIFVSGPASESFDGGGGTDYVVFSGKSSDYVITLGATGMPSRVSGPNGNDVLANIERLKFSDGVLAFDGQAAQVYRLYEAALDRAPDVAGLSWWVHQFDIGSKTLLAAASDFLHSPEFVQHFGDLQNVPAATVIQTFYRNILGREGESGGVNFWLDQLDHGASPATVLVLFSESNENQALVNPQIVGGIHLDNMVFPAA